MFDLSCQLFTNVSLLLTIVSFVDVIVNAIFDFFAENCSRVDCNKSAELECAECVEMYCAACCDKVHKMVRGFRKHKISPLTRNLVKEISKTCSVHVGAILEYHCRDCSVDVCCHCFIQEHTGHSYFLVTSLVSFLFLSWFLGGEQLIVFVMTGGKQTC